MGKLRGVCVGAGYFSQYHFDAWSRIEGVEIVALCERDRERAGAAQRQFGLARVYEEVGEMLEREKPDFIDLITPPGTHADLCGQAADRGIPILCQKPLAPTLAEARGIVDRAREAGVRLMVNENFRFQPWHRQIKRLLEEGILGPALHSLSVRCRLGDGWGEQAYLARQPYFRDYPRLFMYETGVHFIDTFRYLAGDITAVRAWLRRLNPVIRGEDCAMVMFEFASGALGQLDANRYNEPPWPAAETRYTFGEFLLEGSGGSIRLQHDGSISVQRLGQPPTPLPYPHERRGFAGDSCYFTQRHFIDRLLDGRPFETEGQEYLKTLAVQEAVYQSAARGEGVKVE
jgi:predicted dehydrogenase